MSGHAADAAVDLVVVGAGIVGAAVAAHAAERGADVVVLDRSTVVAAGATGRSGGMVRAYDPDPATAELAAASLAAYRDPARWPGGTSPLRSVGAVTVVDPAHEDALRAAVPQLRERSGAAAHVVSGRDEVAGLRLAGGVALVEPDAGWVDPVEVTTLWLRRAVAAGARVRRGVRVVGVEDVGDRARVRTDGGHVLARDVVLAVGPWGPRSVEGVRTSAPVRARSIQVSVVDGRPPGPDHATLLDLRTGVYARPYGPGRTLIGMPHVVWDSAVDAPPDPDHARATFAALTAHLPWLPTAHVTTTVRSADAYVVAADADAPVALLSATGVPRVHAVRGWDGGGVKVAPEAGRRIADAVLAGHAAGPLRRGAAPAAAAPVTTSTQGEPWLTFTT
ncbi:FAD-dependent oxidoreductase [Cellulomonas iranensis]|uniref:Glycine/D-amino acid oxidase-like deaminating enzyme n=1 Tax=Cellulomonas iranensis TaxID=76862 RepID=A0ABU0GJ60_9CELL|nr:FAD-dependent oxidoreductase [Cellulomonas iranensis]MDQ0425382.1 glycine/D-amino acid oxidase-like deaminating enzyme [Cellulomonas iranensis]